MAKIDKYKQLLINLFPLGRLWRFEDQPTLSSLIRSWATEFSRIDNRVADLLNEADPRITNELLEDWERAWGLPDECTPDDIDISERREQLIQKITNIGGISEEFYEFLIGRLGFEADVTNPLPFRAGKSQAGDALTNDFEVPFVAGSKAGDVLLNVGWRYFFNVELPATASEIFMAGDPCGQPLRSFTNELIECTIRKLKPAHTGVTFTFIE